jgi:bisphosphoglycerate-dependent phosphoglycerate mutase
MGLVGFLISLPYMLLFYVSWIICSLFRPVLFATVVCLLTNPAAAKDKINLFITTFQYLFLCKDKKYKKPKEDPASFFKEGEDMDKIERKTLVFIRHGESTWNDTFNKGDRSMGKFLATFIPNLIKAAVTEWYFLASGKCTESWFFDSPLSAKGISQAEGVQKYLRDTNPEYSTPKEAKLIRILTGETEEKCQLMSSNLRRAISTICIGLKDRLNKKLKDDKIMILTQLQEVSTNPDALSIAPAKAPLVSSWMDSDHVKSIYAECDTSKNDGNKSLKSNGLQRMQEFSNIVFDEVQATNIVATGHSYWFRAYFQTYLPHTFDHVSKKKKLINGGVVGFDLLRKKTDKGDKYMIDPKSLVVLYGGF